MRTYDFTVIVQPDEEGNFIAICPALQGCYTEGKTPDEALENIQDVIRLHIEDRISNNETILEEVYSSKMTIAA